MGLAANASMNFGAAVALQTNYPNGVDWLKLVDRFFGDGAAAQLLRPEINPKYKTNLHKRWNGSIWGKWYWDVKFKWMEDWRRRQEILQEHLNCRSTVFITGKVLNSVGWATFPRGFL